MKDFVWVKNKLELFLMTDAHLNIDANVGVFYNETKPCEFVYFDIVAINNPRREKRSSYCIWKDEFKPSAAFEILKGASSSEIVNQLEVLKNLGVKEQYIFDPEYNHLRDGLIAYHLNDGEFEDVKIEKGRIFSPALGLEIVDTGETLRLFNPETKEFLPTMEELTQQSAKIETLELEVEKLKAELAKLKRQN